MPDQKIEFLLSAVDRASPVFRGVESSLDRVRGSYGQLTAILGGAGVAGALITTTKSAIDAADQLNKMSQKVGFSVERLSELKFGAELADVGIEALGTGLKKFNVAIVEASNPTSQMAAIFKSLGVDIKAGPDAALRQFAQAVSMLEDGELKTALATKVLGKAGMDLIPWLNAGAKGMEDAATSARRLGLVMSADLAKQSEELNDNLKKLATSSQALGVTLANQVAGGLATLTGELVKAKEEGNFFLGIMKEIAKLDMALLSKLPGPLGAMADSAATALFDESGKNGAMNGPQSGVIRRPGGPTSIGQAAPDKNALRKALSDQDRAAKDRTAERERDARAQVEGEMELAKEIAEAWDYWGKIQVENNKRDTEANIAQWQAVFDEIDAQQEREIEAARQFLEAQEAVARTAKKTDSVMQDLGFTMLSSAENAILHWQGVRNMLRGVLDDMAKVVIRKGITDPLAGIAGDFLKSLFPSPTSTTTTGGAKAFGGGVDPGMSYLVGENGPEMFTPGSSGTITPNGGGTVINITYNPGGGGGAADAQAMAGALVPLIKTVVRGEITTQLRPGGVFG